MVASLLKAGSRTKEVVDFFRGDIYFSVSLLVVAVSVCLVLDYSLWGFSVIDALFHGINPALKNATPVLRYATIPSAAASMVILLYLLRSLRIKAALYAPAGIVFSMVLFETVWHIVGYLSPSFPSEYMLNIEGALLLVVFWAVSMITIKFWHFGRLQSIMLLLYAVGWLAWFLSGYPQSTSGSISWIFYNGVLKTGSFVLVISLFIQSAEDNIASPA